MKIIQDLHGFFFEEISATGFGMMRAAWAAVTVVFLVGSATDVVRYYSDMGILPNDMGHLVFRNDYRFTLLSHIEDPTAVILLWCTLVLSLLCTMVGMWPRLMTIVSVLLLFSFHERNLQPLGGGDTMLRTIGFLLMLSPELRAFSLDRALDQWKHWQKKRKLLPTLTMPIWPYRLMLWQFIIIYLTSGWDKLQGTMWLEGTTVAAVFHHTHFFRFPEIADYAVILSPLICGTFLSWEFLWMLLLLPRGLWWVMPAYAQRYSLKRWLLLFGVLFHGGIFLTMEVGSFSFAMMAGYLGLLLDRDFDATRKTFNRSFAQKRGKIIILYDGICHLCIRSMFVFRLIDHLHRIEGVDFRDTKKRQKIVPKITEKELDRAMHIKLPDGSTYKGFDAFRVLSAHVPLTQLLTPLLYLPGVDIIGRAVYARVAANRNKCANGVCTHT